MLTPQEWHARLIERAAWLLIHSWETTPAEHRTWSPSAGDSSQTRSATDQLVECINVNNGFAAMLTGGTRPDPVTAENTSDLPGALTACAALLATTIRNMDEGELDREYMAPWGPIRGWNAAELALSNMYYHFGQINYIQTLYGDVKFHIPEGFFA